MNFIHKHVLILEILFYRWKDGEVIAPNPELVISILGKRNIDKIHIIMREGRVHILLSLYRFI